MSDVEQLKDLDIFFFYGENDLDLETKSDILLGLIQKKRTMYYNRLDGAGISNRENSPNALLLQVVGRYDIINWVSLRNTRVSDGSNGPDRRVAVSQKSIKFTPDDKGNIDVAVLYIPLNNIQSTSKVALPIGGG